MPKLRIVPRQPVWEHGDQGSMRATRVCQITGEKFVFTLSSVDYTRWRRGEHIQNVFPQMSSDQREILISGYTPAEWKEIFG